jgi:hypothetical protein
MSKTNTFEKTTTTPETYKRRRRVAAAITGLILAPIVVKAGIESYGYGYHPDQNPQPTYFDTHSGVNPADVVPNSSGK